MCIRDEENCCVLSKTMRFILLCSVDVEETLEFYHVIWWIQDLYLSNVDFEVESKSVIDYFN